ncbi:MAG: septation protein SpoVG family protein [bacterium]
MVYKFIRRWKGLSVAGLVVFLLSSAVWGAEKKKGDLDTISVTRVKVEPVESEEGVVGVAKVMLNECIVVREIKVMKVGDRTVLKFPEYISKKGIVYPQIKFLTEEVKNAVVEAIQTGEPSESKVEHISFKVTDWFRLRGAGKRKVNVEVTFNNALAVSCGIMEGKRGPWVAWPARPPEKHRRQWVKQIYIYDKGIKQAVDKLLLTKYEAMLQEEGEQW